MRLTCPNCDAQYEVPDNVVPVEGRDVQCSNCGQTWFQHHADHQPEPAVQDVEPPQPAPEPDPAPEPEPAPRQENKGLDDLDDLEGLEEALEAPQPQRKELDPAVADILREEAEAEQAARANRASDPLESQPDLGLEGAEPDLGADDQNGEDRTMQARRRMARLRGEPEPMSEADVNAAAVSSRRDLLPDIDEINSTLRTKNDRGAASDQPEIDAPTTKRRRRGFRTGFLLILILIAILVALYIYAPQIAQAVPQVDPYLSSYVAWVDQMRGWLDGQVQSLLRWLDTMAQSSSDG